MKTKEQELKDEIKQIEQSQFIELARWLYKNHSDVLEEWEKEKNVKVVFV